jgi:hypothetical protein
MVEGQFPSGQHDSAILAGVPVAQKDVFPRERASLVRDAPVFEEPDHGRHGHPDARRVQDRAVLFFRLGDPFQHQHEGAARAADVDRFVRGIQH